MMMMKATVNIMLSLTLKVIGRTNEDLFRLGELGDVLVGDALDQSAAAGAA
jgi:hypothetical protein